MQKPEVNISCFASWKNKFWWIFSCFTKKKSGYKNIPVSLFSNALEQALAEGNGRDRGATLRLGGGGMTEYWGGHNTLFLTNSL